MKRYIISAILFLFTASIAAEEYVGICSLISQDERNATFESAGMSAKSRLVEENAIHSLFHTLFYVGIEDVNNGKPLVQKENKTYTNGFFKKAVKYIKKRVDNPLFVVFSEDCEWCKENIDVLGLTDDDAVAFVDWNNGDDSYRDMQLMSLCKHNIITKSSFGWWAAYINPNPDKIVVSQVSEYYSKVYI